MMKNARRWYFRRGLPALAATALAGSLLTVTPASDAMASNARPAAHYQVTAAASWHYAGSYITLDQCDFAGFDNWVMHNWYPWYCQPVYIVPPLIGFYLLYEWY